MFDRARRWVDDYLFWRKCVCLDWTDFMLDVADKFRDQISIDVLDPFKKLHQHGSIESYIDEFYSLRSTLLRKTKVPPDLYVFHCFLGGLQIEVKSFVEALKPVSIAKAIEYAKLQHVSSNSSKQITRNPSNIMGYEDEKYSVIVVEGSCDNCNEVTMEQEIESNFVVGTNEIKEVVVKSQNLNLGTIEAHNSVKRLIPCVTQVVEKPMLQQHCQETKKGVIGMQTEISNQERLPPRPLPLHSSSNITHIYVLNQEDHIWGSKFVLCVWSDCSTIWLGVYVVLGVRSRWYEV